jgi:hypothetical protein
MDDKINDTHFYEGKRKWIERSELHLLLYPFSFHFNADGPPTPHIVHKLRSSPALRPTSIEVDFPFLYKAL